MRAIKRFNPVGYWPLNEISGLVARNYARANLDSLNGVTTGATVGQPGLIGRAYTFNGTSDYVEVNTAKILGGDTTITLSAIVKTSNASRDAIYAERPAAGNDICKFGTFSDNKIEFIYRDDEGNLTTENSDSAISTDAWTYVTVVRNGANVLFYVDGLADGTGSMHASTTANFTGADIKSRIGGDAQDTGADWTDLIQHVAIFDKVLTAAQILKLAQIAGLA